MHYEVFKGLLIISVFFANTSGIEIDGKLDFGTPHSSTGSFRSNHVGHKNVFVPVKHAKPTKTIVTTDDFDSIGVVCISGGCGSTKSTNISEGTIQTDVVVHVQTKIDLNHNKTKVEVDDTPDIPVVVGYGGSKLDSTFDEEDRSLNPQSVFIPDLDPSSQLPSYTPSYPSASTSFNGPSINTYYSSPVTPSVNSRVDSVSTAFDNYNPPVKTGGFYITKTSPDVNINIESLPPASASISGLDKTDLEADLKYKANTIEVKIPYFEPSYHNHYYGENPPPPAVWYPKKTNTFNPVEFKTVKSTWAPSLWNRKVAPHRHSTSVVGAGAGVQCTCKEGQKVPGIRWYPSTSRAASFNDPGSQINDKLAPLN